VYVLLLLLLLLLTDHVVPAFCSYERGSPDSEKRPLKLMKKALVGLGLPRYGLVPVLQHVSYQQHIILFFADEI
jgi:hypothetical protein